MPSSRSTGRISSSRSRVKSEYSVWSAVIGWVGVGRADVGGGGLREPEVADLAGLDQLGHGADGLLDRDRLVDAVLVVEVDVVDAEALEAGVAGGADVLRLAVDADPGAVGLALVAELGGELDLVAASGDGLADELLVGEGAVHVGRVEERHAQVEGAVDGVDALLLVRRAVELAHAHAAEAHGRDGEVAELSLLDRHGRVNALECARSQALVELDLVVDGAEVVTDLVELAQHPLRWARRIEPRRCRRRPGPGRRTA